ncbi:MAG: hypothetical protein AB4426_16570 [Xenococcaceae cyanobacterium]
MKHSTTEIASDQENTGLTLLDCLLLSLPFGDRHPCGEVKRQKAKGKIPNCSTDNHIS